MYSLCGGSILTNSTSSVFQVLDNMKFYYWGLVEECSMHVFVLSFSLCLSLYLRMYVIAWDWRPPFASVWPWPEPNFPDNQNCPSRLRPEAESLWDITYDAIHPIRIREYSIMTNHSRDIFSKKRFPCHEGHISLTDDISTVGQTFVGNLEFHW